MWKCGWIAWVSGLVEGAVEGVVEDVVGYLVVGPQGMYCILSVMNMGGVKHIPYRSIL